MRNNYYDSGWKWVPPQEENKGPLEPPTAHPYGGVYDPAQPAAAGQGGELPPQPLPQPAEPVAQQVERVIITRQDQLATTPQLRQGKQKPRRNTNRKTGIPGFLVCLALVAVLVAGVLYTRGGISFTAPPGLLDELFRAWEEGNRPGSDLPDAPSLPGRDDSEGWKKFYYDYVEEEDWTESLKKTSIKRAPVGDGTVLTIAAAPGDALTPDRIYEKVNPSIVAVQVEQGGGYYSLGSGVILSADGYIITNAHVIAGGKNAEVLLSDDSRLVATLVGYDKSYDLAVLKVKGRKDLPVAEFGDSDALRVGDPAWAIGNPLGIELRGTMTDGMVSAINRDVSAENGDMTLIQTTAALNSGNSGGALINASGQVIGITNMKMMSDEETIEGLGFAIPTNAVKEVVDQIIAQGFYDDGIPLLGVTVYTQAPDGTLPAGAYVSIVDISSDAYQKGIRAGDIIVAANGVPITTIDELLAAKADLKPGDTLALTVWRAGEETLVEITLMTRHQMDEG